MARRESTIRLDQLLLRNGIATDIETANALVLAGRINVPGIGDVRSLKSGTLLPVDARVFLKSGRRYVSRGGLKLDHALRAFDLDVQGMVVLDVGASTGGFTDCVLKQGAARVYAVDVGRAQLNWNLRNDNRVIVMEKVNAKDSFELPEQVDLALIDVSFISLRYILASVIDHVMPEGTVLALIKPQFEAKRHEVGIGGVIRDPQLHALIIGRVIDWVVRGGIRLRGLAASPITGERGNMEFFLWIHQPKPG